MDILTVVLILVSLAVGVVIGVVWKSNGSKHADQLLQEVKDLRSQIDKKL